MVSLVMNIHNHFNIALRILSKLNTMHIPNNSSIMLNPINNIQIPRMEKQKLGSFRTIKFFLGTPRTR